MSGNKFQTDGTATENAHQPMSILILRTINIGV